MALTPDQVYLAKFLLSKNHTPEVVAGMLGNIAIETGDGANPNAYNPRENAKGVVQWTPAGGRQAAVDEYMRTLEGVEPWSLPAQAHALQWELDNSEKNAALALAGATTPAEAASIFDAKYERSSGEHRDRRVAAANDIYKAMGEMDLANVDLAKLAITQNQPWPTNPMANDAMNANPPSGPTTFGLNSIMSPQENEKSAFHPTLGLQGLGAAIAAGSMGESAADDLANLRKQYFGERETEAERQRQEQQRAAMGPIFQKHPDLYAAWQAGAPAEQLLGIATARENMTWQTGERLGGQDFKAKENELDRGLTREELEQREQLALQGYSLDQKRIDQRQQEIENQADQFDKSHNYTKYRDDIEDEQDRAKFAFDREKFTTENSNWVNQFEFEKQKYAQTLDLTGNQGTAARELLASTAERLGNTETAKKIRSMPDSAFSDPSMVGQFEEMITAPVTDKAQRAADIDKFEYYLDLKTRDPKAAQQFYNGAFGKKAGVTGGVTAAEEASQGGLFTPRAPLGPVNPEETKSTYRRFDKEKEQQQAMAPMSGLLDTMLAMAQSGRLKTGPISSALMPFQQGLLELGMIDNENNFVGPTSEKEVFRALANRIYPTMRQVGSGSLSDYESKALEQSFANIDKSPEANIMILQSYDKLLERQAAYLDAKADYIGRNGTDRDFDAQWNEAVKNGDPRVGAPIVFTEEQFGKDETTRRNFAEHVKAGNFGIGSTIYLTVPPNVDPELPNGGTKMVNITTQDDLDVVMSELGITEQSK